MNKSNRLESKIGRLIVGRIAGTVCNEEELEALRDGTMGGITLFKDNAVDLVQLASLINQIYRAYEGTPFVAVDQEGGPVQRFDHILTPLPSAMALGATEDWDIISAVNRINARQSKMLGINCLLAPVMDICSEPLNPIIGTRAFSDNPNKVREWARIATKAIVDEGVIAAGKHFPGHGDTKEDSHTGLAVNHADGKVLWQRELIPFKECASDLPSILVAHVWHPSIDSDKLPASLSPRVVSGLLREYLKFDGLVMTDDLLMKAITDQWGLGEAAVLSVLAGVDMLLVCGNMQQTREVHDALAEAVSSGRIPEQRLEQAIKRVETALEIADVHAYHPNRLQRTIENLREEISGDYQTSLDASKKAITVLSGKIPEEFHGEWVIVEPDHPRYKIDLAARLKETFGREGRFKEATFSCQRYNVNPDPDEVDKIGSQVEGKNCIYVTYRALLNSRQQMLGMVLAHKAIPRLTVAVDTPYDSAQMIGWKNCLATYDPSDLAIEALALILAGQGEPGGKSPVELQQNPQIRI